MNWLSSAPEEQVKEPEDAPKDAALHPLKGRAIVVTGAASGIGRATALLLAASGARLALTDQDQDAGREICAKIRDDHKTDVVFATLDVTDHDAVAKLMRTFLKSYKRLDGLVNCAGVNLDLIPQHETPMELYRKTMDINVQGSYSFCQAYLQGILSPNNLVQPPSGCYSIV